MSRLHHLAALLGLSMGVALAALPSDAGAASLPSKAPWLTVGTNSYAYPQFSQPGQARWFRVALKQGKDYAVYGYDRLDDTDTAATLTLYNAKGQQLLSVGSLLDLIPGNTLGAEFRAPTTDTYWIKVVGHPTSAPKEVGVGVSADCREGPKTKCILAVGENVKGNFNFLNDADWHRVAAKASRDYTVTVTGGVYGAAVQVVDRDGANIAYCRSNETAQPCEAKFKAKYQGAYYLHLIYANDYDESVGSYTVALATP